MSDPVLGRYELYRIVTDYEGLKEAFNDRIEDLDTPMSEIDTAADLTPGHTQKLLCKSNADWSRSFTWKTLGPMLKGTGLALVLVVDDERFAPVKVTLAKRRRRRDKPGVAKGVSKEALKDLIATTFANHGSVGGRRRSDLLSPRERREVAKSGAKARWSKKRTRNIAGSPAA